MPQDKWLAEAKRIWRLDLARNSDQPLTDQQLLERLAQQGCPDVRNPLFITSLQVNLGEWMYEFASASGEKFSGARGEAVSLAASKFPEWIGQYRVLDYLGEGGTGIVYLGWAPKLHRQVAIKVLRHGTFSSEEERKRFTREAQNLASLDHENIVKIYDSEWTTDNPALPYLILERITGEEGKDGREAKRSLEEFRESPVWDAEDAANLVRILADAIHHAHCRKVLHRDLKPGNVLMHFPGHGHATAASLDLDGNRVVPKIVDFGLGKRYNHPDMTKTGDIIGTLYYASPELLAGHGRDAKETADVYGLGAILYRLLCGRRPYEEVPRADAMRAIQDLEYELTRPRVHVPGIPRVLEAICLKCLAKLPEARYATAAELASDLQKFLNAERTLVEAEGVFMPRTGIFAWSASIARFHAWRSLIIAAAFLGLLENLALYLFEVYPPPPWVFFVNHMILFALFVGVFILAWVLLMEAGREVLVMMTSATVSAAMVVLITNLYRGGNWMDDNLTQPFICICNTQAAVLLAYRLKRIFYVFPVIFWMFAFLTAWDKDRAPLWFGIGWFVVVFLAGISVPKKTGRLLRVCSIRSVSCKSAV